MPSVDKRCGLSCLAAFGWYPAGAKPLKLSSIIALPCMEESPSIVRLHPLYIHMLIPSVIGQAFGSCSLPGERRMPTAKSSPNSEGRMGTPKVEWELRKPNRNSQKRIGVLIRIWEFLFAFRSPYKLVFLKNKETSL